MERLSINQADVERHRDTLRTPEAGYDKPCPGSVLVQDDDIQWLGFVNARIIWGHPDPESFYAYAPDIFGDSAVLLHVSYVNDRAPVNASEPALPIYPEPEPQQEQASDKGDAEGARQQGGRAHKGPKKKQEPKQALHDVLKQLKPDQAKAARERIRALRPDLI